MKFTLTLGKIWGDISMRRKTEKALRIEKICKELGVSSHTYYTRIKRGWTEDEAILIPKMGAVYKINGEPVYSYLKRVGGSYRIFSYRIKAGYDLNDAIVYACEKQKNKRGIKK
jgi:hypothetical protein